MKVELPKGKYVLAVSGGVDSMVLLDLLVKHPGLRLIVAHFNHGIRPDSGKDEELVAARAKQLGIPFEAGYGKLGKNASEAAARQARYRFLETVQKKNKAKAIITAHHQDDVIETAFINLLRGTGRRGLAAISSNENVRRPLLSYSKNDIMTYAKKNKLRWREDTTNQDEIYLRNYIRKNLLPQLTTVQRLKLISDIDKVAKISKILNSQIAKLSHSIYKDSMVNRLDFVKLPMSLGDELIVHWLRELNVNDFNRKTINRVNISLRTSPAGTSYPIKSGLKIEVGNTTARFINSL